jgi:hypothetical protein
MINKLVNSQLLTVSRLRSWWVPHKIALLIVWLVTTISMTVILIDGVGGTNLSIAIRQMLHVLYVVVLLWYLARTGPSLSQLPEGSVPVKLSSKIGAWLSVLGVALLFLLNIVSADGRDLLILLSLIAFVVILLVWGRSLSLGLVIQAFAVALFAYLAGSQWVKLGVLSQSWNSIMSAFTVLFYIAGGLLLKHTGLGGMQLLSGQVGEALKSVCVGSLLFLPLGLINALGDPIVDFTVVREWLMSLWLPWWSGINEETWFRLYLIGLTYFLLRPAFHKYQSLAVIAAVLFSAITFGVGHGRDLGHFLTTGLLYGGSFAVIFVKRDWEHAVGAHYMVNFIPALIAFLLN